MFWTFFVHSQLNHIKKLLLSFNIVGFQFLMLIGDITNTLVIHNPRIMLSYD